MNSILKAGTLSLISLFTTVVAITSSAHAEDRVNMPPVMKRLSIPLGCSLQHNKEFTQAVVIKNITNQTIDSGKILYSQVYYYGKAQGKRTNYTLPNSLAPGQSTIIGDEVSSQSSANYTCKAFY
jgi:hypothetical protein